MIQTQENFLQTDMENFKQNTKIMSKTIFPISPKKLPPIPKEYIEGMFYSPHLAKQKKRLVNVQLLSMKQLHTRAEIF